MPKFTKDVLYPDTYHLPDGRKLTITPEESKQMGKRMQDMLAAGLKIPMAWEHQPDAVPMSETEYARQAGEATKLNLGFTESAGADDQGVVHAVVDVPVEEDAKRIPAARFVSPGIRYDWKDSTGKTWPGPSIVHLAVTNRPVQHKQEAFKPVSMSQSSGMAHGRTFCLSLYGEAPMADDKGKKGEQNGESKGGVDVKGLMKLLSEAWGIVLPDDTSEETLMDRLRTVAIAAKPPETEPATSNNTQPVSMSAAEKRLVQMGKIDLERRAKALHQSGRISKPIYDKIVNDLKGVNLSLAADGSFVVSPVESKIAAYEDLPQGQAFNLSQNVTTAEPPAYAGQGTSEDPKDVNKQVDNFFALTGSQTKK